MTNKYTSFPKIVGEYYVNIYFCAWNCVCFLYFIFIALFTFFFSDSECSPGKRSRQIIPVDFIIYHRVSEKIESNTKCWKVNINVCRAVSEKWKMNKTLEKKIAEQEHQTIRKSKMKNTHIILHTGWTCKRRWMAMSESYNILKYKVQHFQHSVAALNVTIECFALDGAC